MKHPACVICRGACCETLTLHLRRVSSDDVWRWLGFHGEEIDGAIILPVPCGKLEDGNCTIYSQRPDCCRNMRVGGPECLRVIKHRRPETCLEIMEQIEGRCAHADSEANPI